MDSTLPSRVSAPARAISRFSLAHERKGLVSVSVFLLGFAAAVMLWYASRPPIAYPLAVAALTVSIPLAAHVSLKVRAGARLYFTGASILLTVVLLPPALAVVVMGIGMGTKELIVFRRCQNKAWQVMGQTGRWMFIALCASFLAHLTDLLITSAFIGGVLWISDVLTAPLVLLTRAPLKALYRRLIAGTYQDELLQYLTGALLVPVILVGEREPVITATGVMALGVWLVLYFILQSESSRQVP